MDSKVVYIAHPYTGRVLEDIRSNIKRAEEFGKQIALLGYAPIIPHNNTKLWDLDSRFEHWTREDWIEKICLQILRKCDAVLFCGDWEQSQGCLREFKEARSLGLQILIAEDLEKLSKEVGE